MKLSNKKRIQEIIYRVNNYTLTGLTKTNNQMNRKLIHKGKVRNIYLTENEDEIILSASNRLSAFDRNICNIPFKGSVLNNVSTYWFNKTENFVPNHLIKQLNETDILVKRTKPILIEFVVRGYITGTGNTSMWKNYNEGCRNYCGHKLPEGLIKNQKLPEILITPTTKGEHDELISKEEIINRNIMSEDEWLICSNYAIRLFKFGQEEALKNGLILVDTKYEFGRTEDGNIILIDEIHTPDSSRFWFHHSYKELFNNRLDPEAIDKEIIRKWIRKNYNPYNLKEEIIIPEEKKELVMRRYIQLYEIITNQKFINEQLHQSTRHNQIHS